MSQRVDIAPRQPEQGSHLEDFLRRLSSSISNQLMPRGSWLEHLSDLRSPDSLARLPVNTLSCMEWPSGLKEEEVQALEQALFAVANLLRGINKTLKAG